MTKIVRWASAVLLVGYLAFTGVVLSQHDAALAGDVIGRVADELVSGGAPEDLATTSRVELVLNILMFAPISFLAAMVLPRHPWANWVVYGFVGSGVVELVQGFLLPVRSAQMVDVVANTAGALLGVLLALPVTARATRRAQREPGSATT